MAQGIAGPPQVTPDIIAARLALETMECAEHPWVAVERGYVLTEDEKRGGETRPMPALPYLKILCDLFMKYPIGIMMKSRQMMASWLFCWVILWTAKFKPGSLSIMQGKRLDDVKAIGTKSLMGRLMFIHRNLPPFLKSLGEAKSEVARDKDKGQKGSETLTTLVIPGGGVVIAAPQGPDVIRSKTATTVCMDELPHHPEGLQAWTAALPTVDGADPEFAEARLWGVGTPNGRDPLCFEMAPWENWREWPELTGYEYDDGSPVEGLRLYLKERSYEAFQLAPVACIRLHYTAEYAPEAWARRRASRAAYPTEGAYEREHEISFKTVAGMAVYGQAGGFTDNHLQSWPIDPLRGVIISMDLGYQGTSACFWQESTVRLYERTFKRQHCFYHQLWKGFHLGPVLDEIKLRLAHYGLDWASARFIADYNTLSTHHGGAGVTDFEVFHANGIYPEARRVGPHQVDQGINLVREAMRCLPDGSPGLTVDPEGAPMVVQMFDGGYRYDDPSEGKGYVETPLKDGVYDHVADSVRYRFWAEPDLVFSAVDDIERDQPERGRTGYVRKYVKIKRKTPNSDRGMGPGGVLGADE